MHGKIGAKPKPTMIKPASEKLDGRGRISWLKKGGDAGKTPESPPPSQELCS